MNQELCITDVDILVEYGSHLDVDCNIEGPKINENVTSVVNKLHLQHISTGQCKAKHPKDVTCQNVEVHLHYLIWDQTVGKTHLDDVKFT